MKLLHVVGTRPNFMKIAPLMRALDREPDVEQQLVHTGQHYDRRLSDVFFEDLEMPHPDHFLGVGSGTHGVQTAATIVGVERILEEERPDATVVPGDVNSTMAAAIAAVKLGIPVVHLEAGLRSRDRSMPEEHNRVVTDHLSDLLLTHSRDADANLITEGISPERIEFVGNTMIDSLRQCEARARELDVAQREVGVENYLLVTLHRPSLVDHAERLLPVMEVLDDIATEMPVLFPVHPRTRGMLEAHDWRAKRAQFLEPQSYLRFLSLMLSAAAVLTDSGGIQEETTALGIPCYTLRTTTERPVTVTEGTNRVLGTGPGALALLQELLASPAPRARDVPEGWDGRAAERAAEAVVELFSDRARAARQAASSAAA